MKCGALLPDGLTEWCPHHMIYGGQLRVNKNPVLMSQSLAVAVAGQRLGVGAGWHAEREGERPGWEGQDSKGRPHLSLREVAASDSDHPLRWCPVLWHQRCTFSSTRHDKKYKHSADSMWVLTASLICPPLIQLYFYAFDIFRESGVPEDQMHYMSIGIGATELIAVTLCVSIFYQNIMKVIRTWLMESKNAAIKRHWRLTWDQISEFCS